MNLCYFTFKDVISKWGNIFIQSHLNCGVTKLTTAFYKRYWIVQNDEQVYMVVKVIKQGRIEKDDIYYKIKESKLTNFL